VAQKVLAVARLEARAAQVEWWVGRDSQGHAVAVGTATECWEVARRVVMAAAVWAAVAAAAWALVVVEVWGSTMKVEGWATQFLR
jgi:hypothetical protein